MSCKSAKKKNVLIVASVASMIDQFNIPNIRLLKELGCNVDVAANFRKGSTCTDEKIQELTALLDELEADCYQIDFDRKVTDIKADVRSFRQLACVVKGTAVPVNAVRHHKITKESGYAFVHAHSPIGGLAGRLIAKKHHIRTVYTAHGFHFYSGAPKKNWMLFYPAEWMLSWITDVLITINREDYQRAKKKFHAKKTVYIPGIGIDIPKFRDVQTDLKKKRAELKIGLDDIMLLSVGELNENKNHKAVLKALGEIKYANPALFCRLHYVIAGKGSLYDALHKSAERLGIHLHLLGFRSDIPELLKAADIFLLPSKREGLNAGLMEAMASGLPCIVSDIRGNRDLVKNGSQGLVLRCFETEAAEAIMQILDNQGRRESFEKNAERRVGKFSASVVNSRMRNLYRSELDRYTL